MKAIVAVDLDLNIGIGNKLLYKNKEDLKHFKQVTSNKILIMGRKTYESIPNKLDNRFIIILTRDKDFKPTKDDAYIIVNDKETCLELIKGYEDDVFIAGGSEIYSLFEEEINEVILTINFKYTTESEGLIKFPFNILEWKLSNAIIDLNSYSLATTARRWVIS